MSSNNNNRASQPAGTSAATPATTPAAAAATPASAAAAAAAKPAYTCPVCEKCECKPCNTNNSHWIGILKFVVVVILAVHYIFFYRKAESNEARQFHAYIVYGIGIVSSIVFGSWLVYENRNNYK